MSDKHTRANRIRWSKFSAVQRSEMMRYVARSKWRNMTEEEARRHVDAMTKGRIIKSVIHKLYGIDPRTKAGR